MEILADSPLLSVPFVLETSSMIGFKISSSSSFGFISLLSVLFVSNPSPLGRDSTLLVLSSPEDSDDSSSGFFSVTSPDSVDVGTVVEIGTHVIRPGMHVPSQPSAPLQSVEKIMA